MFNSDDFIYENLMIGMRDGSFTPAQVNLYAMNYSMRGMISQDTFSKIQTEVKAYQAELAEKEAERKRKEEELKKTQEELEKAQAEHDKAQQDLDEANSQMKTPEATESENEEQAETEETEGAVE